MKITHITPVYNSVFKRHLHRHDVMEVRRIFDAGDPNGP